jgi:tetratricopeptide (TPR) repeat protein
VARIVDGLCTALLEGPTPSDAGIRRCEVLLAESSGDPLVEANVLVSYGGLLGLRGEFDEARSLLDRARSAYHELGLLLPIAGLTGVAGTVELLAGEVDAGEEALREGYDIFSRTGARSFLAGRAPMVAEALLLQGRDDEAGRLLDHAERSMLAHDIPGQVRQRAVRALLEAKSRNASRAVELADEAVRRAAETDALTLHADAVLARAEVLRLVGRTSDTAGPLREALALYERKGHLVGAARVRAGLSPLTV